MRVKSMQTIMREMNLAHAFSADLFELIIELLYEFFALNVPLLCNSHTIHIIKFISNI